MVALGGALVMFQLGQTFFDTVVLQSFIRGSIGLGHKGNIKKDTSSCADLQIGSVNRANIIHTHIHTDVQSLSMEIVISVIVHKEKK